MQCKAVQFSAVQCCAVQCSALQCSSVHCSAVQCSVVRYSTVLLTLSVRQVTLCVPWALCSVKGIVCSILCSTQRLLYSVSVQFECLYFSLCSVQRVVLNLHRWPDVCLGQCVWPQQQGVRIRQTQLPYFYHDFCLQGLAVVLMPPHSLTNWLIDI